jgi:asparagine synthase (glutamine-hydrolysing)
MCGIAALISRTGQKIDKTSLYMMLGIMHYRGDTHQLAKTEILEQAGLGCVRLAIMGRENGEQPFTDPNKEVFVVFNGEIYNHRELRREIEQDGVKFQSDCDTEVLVHGYRKWGTDLPGKLEGMYGFVVFDRTNGDFFAARDPFGIKPLYYGMTDNQWAFSSEIYPLCEVNSKNIREVPPGGYVKNGVESERELLLLSPVSIEPEIAKAQLREFIKESVRKHLDTDLDVAVLVSGGIDSSILLYEAAQILPGKVKAYCVGTQRASDMQHAKLLVEHLKANGIKVELRPVYINPKQMVESIPQTVFAIESFEPNHIRAGTTNLALAERVKADGIKIALCGEGADELLGGYTEHTQVVEKNEPDEKVYELFNRFVRELHKTQLQRVDRTAMQHGIEARVPYLENKLARFILSLPVDLKVHRNGGDVISKYILRETYRGLLPEKIVERRKVPMGEGAGIGDNGPKGPFYERGLECVDDQELAAIQKRFPQFNIQNREEAYYFSIYQVRFGDSLEFARQRPMTNILPTT